MCEHCESTINAIEAGRCYRKEVEQNNRIHSATATKDMRQMFDTARGKGHILDLLHGGFPGADAPSIGVIRTFSH